MIMLMYDSGCRGAAPPRHGINKGNGGRGTSKRAGASIQDLEFLFPLLLSRSLSTKHPQSEGVSTDQPFTQCVLLRPPVIFASLW